MKTGKNREPKGNESRTHTVTKSSSSPQTGLSKKDLLLGESELERLLDRIQCGTIEDVGDLEPEELEMLQRYCQDGEEAVALFDRLRGTSRENG